MSSHFLYILASKKNGTLYVGVTHNLSRRIHEHKQGIIPSFTTKYEVQQLVYVEKHSLMIQAVAREKVIKKWRREWKINLIEKLNPEWKDLSNDISFYM